MDETAPRKRRRRRKAPQQSHEESATVSAAGAEPSRRVTRSSTRRSWRRAGNAIQWLRPGLLTLPLEIQLEILKFLGTRDLLALRRVSTDFEPILRSPTLWKVYEIWNNGMTTTEVVDDLKRMPLLKAIFIYNRLDCDKILRQISLSNKKLEKLYISNCIGTYSKLTLGSGHLTRILERCDLLRSFRLEASRFSGLKFYRLLGRVYQRLRDFGASCASASQLYAFASQLSEDVATCLVIMHKAARLREPNCAWPALRYSLVGGDRQAKTLIFHGLAELPTEVPLV